MQDQPSTTPQHQQLPNSLERWEFKIMCSTFVKIAHIAKEFKRQQFDLTRFVKLLGVKAVR